MKASDEIMLIKPREYAPFQIDQRYKWGHRDALVDAHFVAYKQELVANHMLEALEMINTEDAKLAALLGDDTIYHIRYALKAYREQQSK